MPHIKKLLCNEPAQQMAAHGDYELLGMFLGAGKAVPAIEDLELRDSFIHAVVAAEVAYVAERKALSEKYLAQMNTAFQALISKTEHDDSSPTNLSL